MKILNLDKYHFKSHLLLNNLPLQDLEFLKSCMVYMKYRKGQSIFVEGAYPSGIFYLKTGKIKKYKLDKEGKEQIFYICVAGELFGYPALLSEEPYSDATAALEDSEIGFISRESFFELLHSSKVFSEHLLKNLSHEFNALVNIVAIYTHKSGKERLALTLLILNEKFREDSTTKSSIGINLSREDLANMVGVAVETLVRMLNDFKDKEIITTKGRKIYITSPRKLAEIVRFLPR